MWMSASTAAMDAYLVKPVSIERLRSTLERWLSIEAENVGNGPMDSKQSTPAIDRAVLAGWLGDDQATSFRCWTNSVKQRSMPNGTSPQPRARATSPN